jgi:hypothetical protein
MSYRLAGWLVASAATPALVVAQQPEPPKPTPEHARLEGPDGKWASAIETKQTKVE